MASSSSSRTAPIDEKAIRREQKILNSDEFYSAFPENECTEVVELMRLIKGYFQRLMERKISPTYHCALNILVEINCIIAELKIVHDRGEVTNADVSWPLLTVGQGVTEHPKWAISMKFNCLIPLVLNRKEIIKALESEQGFPAHPLIVNT